MNLLHVTVNGRIPSKKNNKVARGVKVCSSKKYTDWEKKELVNLMLAGMPKEELICKQITLRFFFPDKRVTDLTNKAEGIMDLLVKHRAIRDDCWQYTGQMRLIPAIDRVNPRCEISLYY